MLESCPIMRFVFALIWQMNFQIIPHVVTLIVSGVPLNKTECTCLYCCFIVVLRFIHFRNAEISNTENAVANYNADLLHRSRATA